MKTFKQIEFQHSALSDVLAKLAQIQALKATIVPILPPALQHFSLSPPNLDTQTIALIAPNNMVASRLRLYERQILPLIQAQYPEINKIKVIIRPETPAPEKEKQAKMSATGAIHCHNAADKVAHKHPKLAASLRRLAQHADDNDNDSEQ